MNNNYFKNKIITPDFIKNDLEKSIILNSNNYGLLKGQTGLSLTYFLLSDLFPDNYFRERANLLLDQVCENICDVKGFNFENGLAGIGWGIEWMIQNGYVKSDANEALEELDDELYKSVVGLKSPNISLENGALGKAMYFYKRLNTQTFQSMHNRYRNICNHECLILLIDEINENLLDEKNGLLANSNQAQNTTTDRLIEVARTLIFMTKALPLKINSEITEKLIRRIITFIKQNEKIFEQVTLREGYLNLLYAYSFACEMLQDVNGVNHARMLYESLMQSFISTNNVSAFQKYLSNRFNPLSNIPLNAEPVVQNQADCFFNLLFFCHHYHGKLKSTWNEAWLLS